MNNIENPEGNVGLLLRRIDDEVQYRRAQAAPPNAVIANRILDPLADGMASALLATETAIIPPDQVHLNLPTPNVGSAKQPFCQTTDTAHRLNDFLPYDDVAFINAAFHAILKRDADEGGLQSYLAMLRGGASKAEILGRLRESPEGRQRGARIDGLTVSFALDTISRWPIIGKFVGIVVAVWNLPNAQRDQRRMSNDLACRLAQTEQSIAEVTSTVYEALKTLELSQNTLSGLTKTFASRSGLAAVQHSMTRTAAALDALRVALPNKVDQDHLYHELQAIRSQVETKATHASVAVVIQQVQTVAKSKSDRKELESVALEFGAAMRRMENIKADSHDVAAIRIATEELAKSVSAFQTVREESQARLTAGMDQAMELIFGIAQSKADQVSVDTLKRETMDAIEQARIQMLRGLESKSERREITTLSNHLIALLQQRPTTKTLMDEIATVKVDQGALQTAREKSDASLTAIDQAMEMIRGIGLSKADQATVDTMRQESMDAIEQTRIHMLRALESKSERQEITALSNHVNALQQKHPTKEELNSALARTDDAIASVGQSKVDSGDLTLLRNEIETQIGVAVDGINGAIQTMMGSKVDQSAISGLQDSIHGALGELARDTEAVRRKSFEETNRAIESLAREKTDQATTDAMRVEVEAAIDRVSKRVNDALAPVISRTQDLRHTVLDQERRLGLLLEEARKRFPDPISTAQIGAMLAEEDHRLDAMYASFEDEFRGTRIDIRQRQSIYLPWIREVKAGTGDAPVVDLGCGRGEWLELLCSEGLSAQGVDRNRIFLASCRELDLDVREQDALIFLQQRKPNSAGAVTSFHLIEHLPHKTLIALIDETLRVLRPGGVVIFETPNPRNLVVSGCNFYLDPTHRRPLPPDLSRYLLEARGFCNVEILEIHPFGSEFQITEGAPRVKDVLNQYFFSAQDYAVIGRKAA